jgi:hypothetical protein
MRLVDQVAQARMPLVIQNGAGLHHFPAARDYVDAVIACPLRYVVDARAAQRCFDLLATDRGMLAAENAFLRVPATSFWLEWPCSPAAGAGSLTGLLVHADESGRSGRVHTFWEQAEGEPVPAQAVTEFDLDHDRSARAAAGEAFAIAPDLHPLAPHILFHIGPAWTAHLRQAAAPGSRAAAVRDIAGNIMAGIEFMFAFTTLLSERSFLRRDTVDLSRLNRQRSKRGKPALLDHVEVRIDLAAEAAAMRDSSSPGRESSRLHHVRGHMVHRGGKTFWRRSHIRGDWTKPVLTRTAHVTHRRPV